MTYQEIIKEGQEDPRDMTAWMADAETIAAELETLPKEITESPLTIYY